MKPELIGFGAGSVFGLVNMVVLRAVASRIEGEKPTAEKKRAGRMLRGLAIADVFIFAVLGYFLAPIFMK